MGLLDEITDEEIALAGPATQPKTRTPEADEPAAGLLDSISDEEIASLRGPIPASFEFKGLADELLEDQTILGQRVGALKEGLKFVTRQFLPKPVIPAQSGGDIPAGPESDVPDGPEDEVIKRSPDAIPGPMGELFKTPIGQRVARNIASSGLSMTGQTLSSIEAADAFFGTDTDAAQIAGKAGRFLAESAQKIAPDDPNFADEFAQGATSMALFMVPGISTAGALQKVAGMGVMAQKLAVAAGAGISTILESAMEAGGVYERVMKEQGNRDAAARAAFHDFWINAIAIGVTNQLQIAKFFDADVNVIKKALKGGAMLEGPQEAIQEIVADLTSGNPVNWASAAKAYGLGAILGAGAQAVVPAVMDTQTLGEQATEYLQDRHPGLYQSVLGKDLGLTETEAKEAIEEATAAGEEVLLKGGTPDEAFQAETARLAEARERLISSREPVQQTPEQAQAQKIAQAIEQEAAKTPPRTAPVPPIEETVNEFDPLEFKYNARNLGFQIKAADRAIRVTDREVRERAVALFERAKEERIIPTLEREVMERGGLRTFRADPATGEAVELEEFRAVPVRLRNRAGLALDEMAEELRNAGVLGEDQDLLTELSNLPKRGTAPRLDEFFPEAQREIELEIMETLAEEGRLTPEMMPQFKAQRRERAREAALKVLRVNKIDDRVMVDMVKELSADTEAFKPALQKQFGAVPRGKEIEILGVTLTRQDAEGRIQAVIQLAENATEATGRHEAFHAVTNILLTDTEQRIILKEYGDMEKAADAFADYNRGTSTPQSAIKTIFDKILDFLTKFRNYLVENQYDSASSIFENIDQGRLVGRESAGSQTVEFNARVKAPMFYSQLQSVLDKKLPAKATVEMVRNIARSQDVKQEDVEWSGLMEWLDEQKGPIAKADVLAFLKQNQVQVQEVVKGAGEWNPTWRATGPGAYTMDLGREGGNIRIEDLGNGRHLLQTPGGTRENFATLEEAQARGGEIAENIRASGASTMNSTKFGRYQLPGGENYRELLLTLPNSRSNRPISFREWYEQTHVGHFSSLTPREINVLRGQFEKEGQNVHHPDNFLSSHFHEPNILAHVRFNERTDTEGKRVLFIEEIQSDWHQKGRELGYQTDTVKDITVREDENVWVVKFPDGKAVDISKRDVSSKEDAIPKAIERRNEQPNAAWHWADDRVPNAPFKKTWHELALKRMLRWAAENGFDRIAWTTGEQQAERYDLSKQLSSVVFSKERSGRDFGTVDFIAFDKSGQEVISKRNATPSELSETIGKELAEKIAAHDGTDGELTGLDLKVGGEGMKGFYDQIVPSFLNKYTKKWGGRVGETYIQEPAIIHPENVNDQGIVGESEDDTPARRSKVHSLDITPSMIDSVVGVGQPQFKARIVDSDSPKNIPPEDYDLLLSSRRTHMQEVRAELRQVRSSLRNFAGDIVGVLSSELAAIDPSLKRALRKFEIDTRRQIAKDLKAVEGFLLKKRDMKKASMADYLAYDYAQKNGDVMRMSDLNRKYGMQQDYYAARNALNAIHKRAQDVGFDIGYLMDYFPRSIKDEKGFNEFMRSQGEWSQLQAAIDDKSKALGRELSIPEQNQVINSFIRGYERNRITLSETPNMKKRLIDRLTVAMNQFYYDSDTSLINYFHRVNEAIEGRRFFGKSAEKSSKNINEYNPDDSIGAYAGDLLRLGKITLDQEIRLKELLQARFGMKATPAWLGFYKTFGYMTTIGNPISAITQLEDIGILAYESSIRDAAVAAGKSLAGKSEITMDDLGFDSILEEMRDGTKFGKALDTVTKTVGFNAMDRFGKRALVNAKVSQLRRQARKFMKVRPDGQVEFVKGKQKDFVNFLKDALGEDTDTILETIRDLADGKKTDNVLFLAAWELLEIQPMALSEVPPAYLTNPNGRIMYTLKTFTVKRLDVWRNRVVNQIAKPGLDNKVRGVKNLVSMAVFLGLAGASRDSLIDFILGRPFDLRDKAIDNLFKMFGFSRYILWRARMDGLGTALIQQTVLFPLLGADELYKDIASGRMARKEYGDLAILQRIPLGGKLYYWWLGGGAEKAEEQRRKLLKKNAKIRRQRSVLKKAEIALTQ